MSEIPAEIEAKIEEAIKYRPFRNAVEIANFGYNLSREENEGLKIIIETYIETKEWQQEETEALKIKYQALELAFEDKVKENERLKEVQGKLKLLIETYHDRFLILTFSEDTETSWQQNWEDFKKTNNL